MLDVHQQQFLVLLFVVQPEGHQSSEVGTVGDDGVDEADHGVVDAGPVVADLAAVGAGDQAPVGAGVTGADGFVVAVEQVPVVVVDAAVAGQVRDEEEGLEEPGGVGSVPLGRAGVGHRLDGLVLGSEGPGEALGEVTDPAVAVDGGGGRGRRRRGARPTGDGGRWW